MQAERPPETGAGNRPVVGWMDCPEFDQHEISPGHPESAARLHAIRTGLAESGLAERLARVVPETVDRSLLLAVHTPQYVARIEKLSAFGGGPLDADTAVGPATLHAALLAAGAVTGAVERVLSGEWNRAFCSVRPPGHHALPAMGMGFCIFNNVAIGAEAALRSGEAERVAILDWDVHHGNGTQEIFWERTDVFYASIHQSPLYPGLGSKSERGVGEGEGSTLNCPLPPGAGDRELLEVWTDHIQPALTRFAPRLLLISAGFDGEARDWLADLTVSPTGYGELTERVVRWADAHCRGRVVSVLEGGYHLEALAEDVVAHVKAMFLKGS